MNKDIRKNAKKGFEKRLFKLMNNSFFRKTMKNVHKRKKKKLFGFIFSQKQMILIKIYNNIETVWTKITTFFKRRVSIIL